ncbi:MAG TPA: substrate-binding domain-containing protein [Pseudonocardia sp.]|nr:substrate-binding domain-containing protein [Pseudonocardia sp.]
MARTVAAVLLLAGTALSACSASPAGSSPAAAGSSCDVPRAATGIDEYVAGGVLGEGPFGETSAPADSIALTDAELSEVRAMGATAAIVMHFSGDTWSTAQVAALRSEFDRMGIEVVAQTSADAVVATQFGDIESALAANPDVMVSIPSMDVNALAPAYRRVADAGVEIVFMDNPAAGMEPGRDYVSVVASDYYGYGVINAHQLARALCGDGEVAVLRDGARAPNNVQALDGFTDTLAAHYPDLTVVEQADILGPDYSGEGESNINAILSRYPDLEGVWCFFDVPCEGAINAARAQGRDSLALTMGGLGQNVATQMAASDDFVVGIGSVQPYQQGVIEARLAAYALIGKEAPPFVSLPAIPVDRENLREAWSTVYDEGLPAEIEAAFPQ